MSDTSKQNETNEKNKWNSKVYLNDITEPFAMPFFLYFMLHIAIDEWFIEYRKLNVCCVCLFDGSLIYAFAIKRPPRRGPLTLNQPTNDSVCLLTKQQQFNVPLGFQPVHLQGVIDQSGPGRRRPLLRRHGTTHFHIKIQLNTIFNLPYTLHSTLSLLVYVCVCVYVVCVIGNRCDTHPEAVLLVMCDMMWSS